MNLPDTVALPETSAEEKEATMGVKLVAFIPREAYSVKHAQAAVALQRMWRAKIARNRFRVLVSGAYERILDPASGFPFWYCVRSGESTWEEPILLKTLQLDDDGEAALPAQGSPLNTVRGRRQSKTAWA